MTTILGRMKNNNGIQFAGDLQPNNQWGGHGRTQFAVYHTGG